MDDQGICHAQGVYPVALPPSLFHVVIDVDQHVVKKNNRPIFKRGKTPFIGKSKRLLNAEKYLYLSLLSAKNKHKMTKPIEGPIWCKYLFMFSDFFTQDGNQRLTLPDLSNLLELPSDELQHAGIIKDDAQIMSFDGSRRLPGTANRLEIFIFEPIDRVTIL